MVIAEHISVKLFSQIVQTYHKSFAYDCGKFVKLQLQIVIQRSYKLEEASCAAIIFQFVTTKSHFPRKCCLSLIYF